MTNRSHRHWKSSTVAAYSILFGSVCVLKLKCGFNTVPSMLLSSPGSSALKASTLAVDDRLWLALVTSSCTLVTLRFYLQLYLQNFKDIISCTQTDSTDRSWLTFGSDLRVFQRVTQASQLTYHWNSAHPFTFLALFNRPHFPELRISGYRHFRKGPAILDIFHARGSVNTSIFRLNFQSFYTKHRMQILASFLTFHILLKLASYHTNHSSTT